MSDLGAVDYGEALARPDPEVDRCGHRQPPWLVHELLELEALEVLHHQKRRPVDEPIDFERARDHLADTRTAPHPFGKKRATVSRVASKRKNCSATVTFR